MSRSEVLKSIKVFIMVMAISIVQIIFAAGEGDSIKSAVNDDLVGISGASGVENVAQDISKTCGEAVRGSYRLKTAVMLAASVLTGLAGVGVFAAGVGCSVFLLPGNPAPALLSLIPAAALVGAGLAGTSYYGYKLFNRKNSEPYKRARFAEGLVKGEVTLDPNKDDIYVFGDNGTNKEKSKRFYFYPSGKSKKEMVANYHKWKKKELRDKIMSKLGISSQYSTIIEQIIDGKKGSEIEVQDSNAITKMCKQIGRKKSSSMKSLMSSLSQKEISNRLVDYVTRPVKSIVHGIKSFFGFGGGHKKQSDEKDREISENKHSNKDQHSEHRRHHQSNDDATDK